MKLITSRIDKKVYCNECRKFVALAVECGDPPDHHAETVHLCSSCAAKIVAMFSEVTP